jgi:hypothetical protein
MPGRAAAAFAPRFYRWLFWYKHDLMPLHFIHCRHIRKRMTAAEKVLCGGRQIGLRNFAGEEQHGALDDIFKFAAIPRPIVDLQLRFDLGCRMKSRPVVLRPEPIDKLVRKVALSRSEATG